MSEMTDTQIAFAVARAGARIEATRALYDLLLALKRNDQKEGYPFSGYNEDERAQLQALHRKHLLRRVVEEAKKAGIEL